MVDVEKLLGKTKKFNLVKGEKERLDVDADELTSRKGLKSPLVGKDDTAGRIVRKILNKKGEKD